MWWIIISFCWIERTRARTLFLFFFRSTIAIGIRSDCVWDFDIGVFYAILTQRTLKINQKLHLQLLRRHKNTRRLHGGKANSMGRQKRERANMIEFGVYIMSEFMCKIATAINWKIELRILPIDKLIYLYTHINTGAHLPLHTITLQCTCIM